MAVQMTDLVERVAKAKWARRQEVVRNAGIIPPLADWDDETEALREEVRAETRCGIAAMREPTNKMLKAACASMSEEKRPTPEYIPVKGKHRVRWQAMIDEALK